MSSRAAPSRQPPSLPDEALGRVSKSQLKRDATLLQKLGADLAAMPASRLRALELPTGLQEALETFGKTRSHEGKRRQLQFVGKLMRQVDAEPLREAVALWKLGGAVDSLQLHEAERWRDELLADDTAVTRLASDHPKADLQQLRALVRQARSKVVADAGAGLAQRQGKAFRELFQVLRSLLAQANSGLEDPPSEPTVEPHERV